MCLHHKLDFYYGLIAVIGENIVWYMIKGFVRWSKQHRLVTWMPVLISYLKSVACHRHHRGLVQCHKMCLSDLQSLNVPIETVSPEGTLCDTVQVPSMFYGELCNTDCCIYTMFKDVLKKKTVRELILCKISLFLPFTYFILPMMTSSNENISALLALCEENRSPVVPLTKGQ